MTSRRTHTKSRNGCRECKRRKVKCDETHPCCFNCARHGVLCSLSAASKAATPGGAIDFNSHVHLHGPNAHYMTPPSVTPAVAFSSLSNLLDTSRVLSTAANNADHDFSLELMHHYCTYTALSICRRADMQHVWTVTVPEFGYRYQYVMHGILAVAALHKAHLLPTEREKYLDISAYYQTLGVQKFVAELQHVDEENWKPAFCFSSTVVLYSLCLPTIKRQGISAKPLSQIVDMFMFVRGLRAVAVPFQGQLSKSQLSPLVTGLFIIDEQDPNYRHPPLENSPLPNEIFEALNTLSEFYQNTLPQPRLKVYDEAVNQITRGAYLGAHAGMNIELGIGMFWVYVVSDHLIADIQSADPHALVLLAYFAMILSVIESRFWFLKGWPKLVFSVIDDNMVADQAFLDIIAWPRKQVFEVYCAD